MIDGSTVINHFPPIIKIKAPLFLNTLSLWRITIGKSK